MSSAPVLGLSLSEVLHDLGYAGLFLLMLAETVFPPIPSEAILPLAGYLVEQGEFDLVGVLVTSTVGSVVGAQLLYEAARAGGRPFALRFIRFARLDDAKLAEAETWFAKRGAIVVLLGRCVPGVRSLVSLPAGVLRMPRWEYLLFTTIGSALWNTILVGAGYLLGTQWERVGDVIGPISKPLVFIVAAVVAVFLVRHAWTRRRRRRPTGRTG
jgi:membrane protein DedA with SNARE-associated domain